VLSNKEKLKSLGRYSFSVSIRCHMHVAKEFVSVKDPSEYLLFAIKKREEMSTEEEDT